MLGRICHLFYGVYNRQSTVCREKQNTIQHYIDQSQEKIKDPKAILADKHCQKSGHRFNEHARFMIIDRLTNINLEKEILRERLIQRENFWIQKLQALYPKGQNQELNMQI